MKKILLLTGDGGESYEALYAVHRMREAGYEVVVAAPSKRRLNLVMHDFQPGWDTYVERQGYGLEADAAIDTVSADDFAAILVLGGRAPEFLRNSPKVIALVQAFAAQDKWLFAICHGIQVFAAAGVLQGKKATCYEHCRLDAEQGGATWERPQAVRDGRLVTAQTWESHPEFYRLVMGCLEA